jgi:hypothetical protein
VSIRNKVAAIASLDIKHHSSSNLPLFWLQLLRRNFEQIILINCSLIYIYIYIYIYIVINGNNTNIDETTLYIYIYI